MTLSARAPSYVKSKYSDASRIAPTDLSDVADVNETVRGYAYLEINLHSSGTHIYSARLV